MTERDNFLNALDAYLEKYIQAHLEKYIPATQPEIAPVTPETTVPDTITNRDITKYDDVSRKEVQDFLRSYNQSVDGLTDAQLALSVIGLKKMLANKNAPETTAPVTSETTDRYSTKYDDASRKEALEIMRMNGLDTEGLSDGLNDAHISFVMSAITEMAAQFPNVYKTKKDIV